MMKAETAVAKEAQPRIVGIAEQLDFDGLRFGKNGAEQPLEQRRLRNAFAQHAIQP